MKFMCKNAILTLFLSAAILISSDVQATGAVVPGSTRQIASSYETWQTSDSLGFPGTKDNSYFCRAVGASSLDSLLFNSTLSLYPGADRPSVVLRGDADGGVDSKQAFAFIANASGVHSIGINVSSGLGTGSKARANFSCYNTTLFGNFNTVAAANPVNYLELKNISTVDITAKVIIIKFDGTEISRFSVAIPVGTRRDLGIQDINGATDTFGSITVAHDGPIGSLLGNVSKYTLSGGTLAITATESLVTRVQN